MYGMIDSRFEFRLFGRKVPRKITGMSLHFSDNVIAKTTGTLSKQSLSVNGLASGLHMGLSPFLMD
jgi:hypothetical protein